MGAPFLLAETPRGGPFGHRFLVPPGAKLKPTEVVAYFHRAALGPGRDFIAVSRQVGQHLPTGAVREGAETLLLAGLEVKALEQGQVQQLRQLLERLLPELAQLVTAGIDWQKAGPQTLIVRDELAAWLGPEFAAVLAPAAPGRGRRSPGGPRPPQDGRAALFSGALLGLAVGALLLYLWFF